MYLRKVFAAMLFSTPVILSGCANQPDDPNISYAATSSAPVETLEEKTDKACGSLDSIKGKKKAVPVVICRHKLHEAALQGTNYPYLSIVKLNNGKELELANEYDRRKINRVQFESKMNQNHALGEMAIEEANRRDQLAFDQRNALQQQQQLVQQQMQQSQQPPGWVRALQAMQSGFANQNNSNQSLDQLRQLSAASPDYASAYAGALADRANPYPLVQQPRLRANCTSTRTGNQIYGYQISTNCY